MIGEVIGIVALGYLLGAIPFGLIVGRLVKGIDIRQYGSGNIGFTNVLRTVGVKSGIITLLADIAKGAVPALLGGIIIGGNTADIGGLTFDDQGGQVVAGIAAVVGHNWSVYLKFGGGKGVDTSLGGLLAMSPLAGVICLLIGVGTIVKSRYVSLGSMVGGCSSIIVLAPMVAADYAPLEYLVYGVIVTVLIILRHRDNIRNLRAGEERKIGRKGEER
ncbi:MAG: glycerol-3-phosphate 1-O-acyltransferase PlsY [Dehalococcoidia bacterium]